MAKVCVSIKDKKQLSYETSVVYVYSTNLIYGSWKEDNKFSQKYCTGVFLFVHLKVQNVG